VLAGILTTLAFAQISDEIPFRKHSVGLGRNDILTPKGWVQAPKDRRNVSWEHHADFDAGGARGSYTSMMSTTTASTTRSRALARGYGVFWMRQIRDSDGSRDSEKKMIDDAGSQAHAMTMTDLMGDGRPELITGKRFLAHNGHDPGGR